MTSSSTARSGWRETTTRLARRAASSIVGHQRSVDARLEAVERHLASIDAQLRELREIAATQVDVENQSTELLGRLLRAATSRIEDLEELVGRQS